MITRYVNTASTAGGDGTTNATVGANRAYAKLSDAAGALQNSSFADDLEILCCGAAADGAANFPSYGNYVQSGFRLSIRSNRSVSTGYHGGKWNTGTYRIEYEGNNNFALSVSVPKFTVDGIQIKMTGSDSWGILNTTACEDSYLDDCLIWNAMPYSYLGIWNAIQFSSATDKYLKIRNCVVTSHIPSSYSGGMSLNSGSGAIEVYNFIVRGFVYGIYRFGGTISIKNGEIFDNGDDFVGSPSIDYCASDDGDGTNPIAVSNWANQFYNANYVADGDFRLKSTSVLLNAGIGPGVDATVPTTDIIEFSRSGNNATVGPFEHYWDYIDYIPHPLPGRP